MADASYYWGKYKEWKNKASEYDRKRSDIKSIINAFGKNPVLSDPNDINKKIKSSQSEHEHALKGADNFTSNLALLGQKQESEVSLDTKLVSSKYYLNSEYDSLTRQYENAVSQRNSYWRKYLDALIPG